MTRSLQQGFTLVELMIVVAITGVLAAIAIPAYQDYIARAQVTESLVLMASLKQQVLQYHAQTGTCPTLASLDVAHQAVQGHFIQSVTIVPGQNANVCTIQAVFKGSGLNSEIASKAINLDMQKTTVGLTTTVQWGCTSSDIEQKYLPKACTGV